MKRQLFVFLLEFLFFASVIFTVSFAGESVISENVSDALDISAETKNIEEYGIPTPLSVSQLRSEAYDLWYAQDYKNAVKKFDELKESSNYLANLIKGGLEPYYNKSYDAHIDSSYIENLVEYENLTNNYIRVRNDAYVKEALCYYKMGDEITALPLLLKALDLLSVYDYSNWTDARNALYDIIGVTDMMTYENAKKLFEEGEYESAKEVFESLGNYSDSSEQVEICNVAILEMGYNAAVKLKDEEQYESAIELFEALGDYKDSTEQIDFCNAAIPERDYDAAVELKDKEQYESAIELFEALGDYKDSAEQIDICNAAIPERDYNAAVKLKDEGDYESAIELFEALGDYKDSAEQMEIVVTLQGEVFRQQPMDTEAYEEEMAYFSIEVNGNKNVRSYQWQTSSDKGNTWKDLDEKTFHSAVTANLNLRMKKDRNGNLYRCIVILDNGVTYTSESAKLTLIE